MFGSLGLWEILAIIAVAALVFGGKKLPQLGKGLGEAITNFKSSLKKDSNEDKEEKKALDNEKEN
jgi:sec-independent protein translocase protein TatA